MKTLLFVFMAVHSISSYAEATRAEDLALNNPELTRRFDFLKSQTLKRKTVLAIIGDSIHIDSFQELIETNPLEVPDNFFDDDGNAFEDDYWGFDFDAGNGRLMAPVQSGHENGIVSLLDALIRDNHLLNTIRILPLNITSHQARFDELYIKKLADAIDYARTRGAEVISMSLGVSSLSSDFFKFIDRDLNSSRAYYEAAIQRAVDAGILLLGAASNDPNRNHSLESVIPGNSQGVISVANVNFKAQRQSAYGENVDLAFYGTDLTVWTGPDTGYAIVKGSSYATPLVALTLAVAKSLHPSVSYKDLPDLKRSCERRISGKKNISSRCVFSPENFISKIKAKPDPRR